jgi:hypothetical protein
MNGIPVVCAEILSRRATGYRPRVFATTRRPGRTAASNANKIYQYKSRSRRAGSVFAAARPIKDVLIFATCTSQIAPGAWKLGPFQFLASVDPVPDAHPRSPGFKLCNSSTRRRARQRRLRPPFLVGQAPIFGTVARATHRQIKHFDDKKALAWAREPRAKLTGKINKDGA